LRALRALFFYIKCKKYIDQNKAGELAKYKIFTKKQRKGTSSQKHIEGILPYRLQAAYNKKHMRKGTVSLEQAYNNKATEPAQPVGIA
jgi:hypothetical protein